ncbi:hypothetical protein HGA91_04170 [candidate division WWE3 bacterium]|nr:hypothetical protein [candidate division WWE3 bacterium]
MALSGLDQPRNQTSRGAWILIACLILLLLGAGATIAVIYGPRLLNMAGIGGITITEARVIGLDAKNRPVLMVKWEGRPLTPNQEWYDVTFQRDGKDLATRIAASRSNEAFFAFDGGYDTTAASVTVLRRPEGSFSDPVPVTFTPIDQLKPLTGADIGVDVKSLAELKMSPPALIPNLDKDGNVQLEFKWSPSTPPANSGWWVWHQVRQDQFVPVPDTDPNDYGNWATPGIVEHYPDPAKSLKGDETCLPVAVMVQMVYFRDNIAVVLQEQTMTACVPPAVNIGKV